MEVGFYDARRIGIFFFGVCTSLKEWNGKFLLYYRGAEITYYDLRRDLQ